MEFVFAGWLGVHPLALILCLLATAPQDPQDAPAGKADPRDAPVAQSPLAPPSPRDARMLGVGAHVADADGRDLDGAQRGWRSGRGEKTEGDRSDLRHVGSLVEERRG
jgi:hypothetical protein